MREVTTPRRRAERPTLRCTECGALAAKWVGRCPECGAWGSVEPAAAPGSARRGPAPSPVSAPAQPIDQVGVDAACARPTGVQELDRVLGGGLVAGAVVLLAGEPGAGKSTLALEVAARAAQGGQRVLYITGEESAAQVRLRAGRTGALERSLWLAAETELGAVLTHVDTVAPDLLVVDSVQTIASAEAEGTAGGPTQVRAVAGSLIGVAKQRALATLVIGHVTKDGAVAGPRLLEHLVDVVLHFEGDRNSALRMVRAVKNRFGPADEVGCFTLTDSGIVGLADPSGLFLPDRRDPVPGTCGTVAVEGRRPLPAEVQALVVPVADRQTPRRAVSGLDGSRVAMVLAVLEKRAGAPLSRQDVFLATVAGARLVEPAADLAVALAVRTAFDDAPLPPDVVALGEVGLSGEIRPVPAVDRRLAEAARLGFATAIVPVGSGRAPEGLRVIEVGTLGEALAHARAMAGRRVGRSRREPPASTTTATAGPPHRAGAPLALAPVRQLP